MRLRLAYSWLSFDFLDIGRADCSTGVASCFGHIDLRPQVLPVLQSAGLQIPLLKDSKIAKPHKKA